MGDESGIILHIISLHNNINALYAKFYLQKVRNLQYSLNK